MHSPPLRPCCQPGCSALISGRTSRCDSCRGRASRARPTTAARGYGSAWQRLAKAHLAEHPLCVFCAGPASEVDHVDGDSRNCQPFNLRSLCNFHHRNRTGRDQAGGPRIG